MRSLRFFLYKVHTLFSLLGVTVAYVTSKGALLGVVGSNELRLGIEHAGRTQTAASRLPQRVINYRNDVSFASSDEEVVVIAPERRADWAVN